MRRVGRVRKRGGRALKRSESCRCGADEREGDPDDNMIEADDSLMRRDERRKRSNACQIAGDESRKGADEGSSEANEREVRRNRASPRRTVV